jgi:hypothetical protein
MVGPMFGKQTWTGYDAAVLLALIVVVLLVALGPSVTQWPLIVWGMALIALWANRPSRR